METSAAGLTINHLLLTELWKRCSQERSGVHIHINTHSMHKHRRVPIHAQLWNSQWAKPRQYLSASLPVRINSTSLSAHSV